MEIIQFLIDFVLHIDVHLAELVQNYGVWIYAILFLIIFCETGLVVTPFLPGDSLLFVAGTLAALATNHINVHLMVLLLITAAILGDATNYVIGKYFGETLFKNPDSKVFKQAYLVKTHEFYEKHGGKTIIIARFVPIIRTFAPFVAGMGKMTYSHFFSFNVIGAIVWVPLFMYAGYFVGENEFVKKNLSLLIILIIFVSLLPGIFEIIRQRMKSKKEQ
jgi:membrane-associated protein